MLVQASEGAAGSGYFDQEDIPDTGSFVGCLLGLIGRETPQAVTLEMTSISLSLREAPAEQSDFAALMRVRSRLRGHAAALANDGSPLFSARRLPLCASGPPARNPAGHWWVLLIRSGFRYARMPNALQQL
jgi:hypothetical protein